MTEATLSTAEVRAGVELGIEARRFRISTTDAWTGEVDLSYKILDKDAADGTPFTTPRRPTASITRSCASPRGCSSATSRPSTRCGPRNISLPVRAGIDAADQEGGHHLQPDHATGTTSGRRIYFQTAWTAIPGAGGVAKGLRVANARWQQHRMETPAYDDQGSIVVPNGSIGFRWGADGRPDQGKWNLEDKEGVTDRQVNLKLSVLEDASKAETRAADVNKVAFPYFGGIETPNFPHNTQSDILLRNVPMQRVTIHDKGVAREVWVATVFDLQVASYGVHRGLKDASGKVVDDGAQSYDENVPYTPAWQEQITGAPRAQVITVARQFA